MCIKNLGSMWALANIRIRKQSYRMESQILVLDLQIYVVIFF